MVNASTHSIPGMFEFFDRAKRFAFLTWTRPAAPLLAPHLRGQTRFLGDFQGFPRRRQS